MKLYKTVLFFLAILLTLFLIQYIFPEEGIKLTEDITIHYPTSERLFEDEAETYKDISHIIDTSSERYQIDLYKVFRKLNGTDDVLKYASYDTVYAKELDTIKPSKPDYYDDYQYIRQPIEYPGEDPALLSEFFKSLHETNSSDRLMRILHYGDSQIEGDRITSYIRNELQKRFGGSGIGMIPVQIKSHFTVSLKHQIADNWQHYSIQHTRNNRFDGRYGVLQGFSRFSPFNPDQNDEVRIFESWIEIETISRSYYRARQFKNIKLFYGYNQKPLIVQLLKQDTLIDADILLPNRDFSVYQWSTGEKNDKYTIQFKGEHSPNVYAIATDGRSGIAMDNIPLRGSAGTDFTRNNFEFLKNIYDQLNVQLIILQFGVNVVPGELNNYDFYEKNLLRQLQFLKRMNPDRSIIIIGVSDMSKKENNVYVSYSNIEKIRNAQKNAAFKAGCAFWDTYEAMGGKNSMPSWVFHEPPLAQKDFTHFTYQGSKIIAKMFLEALMKEYEIYSREK